ncbi:MAG: hypothetical protein OEZ22_02120 [Spirochaetia bacterium]|nr:hypothetical protein [Spirochaetia bacterium]
MKVKIKKLIYTCVFINLFYCTNTVESNDDTNGYKCPVAQDIESPAVLESYNYDILYTKTPNLVVMSRNLYLGADLSILLSASEADASFSVLGKITTLFNEIIKSEFVMRAQGIAREIKEINPDIINLQEVEILRTGVPDFLSNPVKNADCMELDFLAILDKVLTEQSLFYQVALKVENADVELTDMTKDIRLTDYDVILVKQGIYFSEPYSRVFDDFESVSLEPIVQGAGSADIKRSYSSILISVNSQPVRIVNTHLDTEPILQGMQIAELVSYLNTLNESVILAGDINSIPTGINGGMSFLDSSYESVINAGFTDAMNTSTLTCCYQILNDSNALLYSKVDHIFYKSYGTISFSVEGEIITGYNSNEMVPNSTSTGSLWPSDHAGIAVGFTIQ